MLTRLGDLIWRSDTRHSEAVVAWIMLGVSFTNLFKYVDTRLMGYVVYAVVLFFVSVIGFSASVGGSYLARIQAAMLRAFCWPVIAIHSISSGYSLWTNIPFYLALTLVEAFIYIKLYLLLSKKREND